MIKVIPKDFFVQKYTILGYPRYPESNVGVMVGGISKELSDLI
jgi:hypothetical protein